MVKIIQRILLIVCAIIFLMMAIPGAAELAVRYQPVGQSEGQASQSLETGNPWVTVLIDERMFTLFAALNAAGYDAENNEAFHPVRQLVRERLAGKTFTGMNRLQAGLQFIGAYNFTVWALYYGQPPEFARVQPGWTHNDIPAFLFAGLDGILRDFYQEMEIGKLWQEVLPEYQAEAMRYQEASGQAVQAALDYTRIQNVRLKQVVVIPNLLNAYWRGYGPTVGESAYVVVGPTGDRPDVGLIQHEALHSIVGPLVEANLGAIEAGQTEHLYAALKERVPPSYGSWQGIVEEQVVRALDCRLSGPMCGEYRLLERDEQEGFLLERTLVENLQIYEQGSASLAEYMPELLAALNAVDIK